MTPEEALDLLEDYALDHAQDKAYLLPYGKIEPIEKVREAAEVLRRLQSDLETAESLCQAVDAYSSAEGPWSHVESSLDAWCESKEQ